VFFDNSVWKSLASSPSVRTESGDATQERLNDSADSLQRDNGQVLATAEEADFHSSLYPCDHFVYPEYRLGSLRDEGCQLGDVVYSAQQRRFGMSKQGFGGHNTELLTR
jgi:hypothetical protein